MYTKTLCHSSPFFRAALTGSFAEATSGEVKLETVSVGTFGLFVDWLYTSRINTILISMYPPEGKEEKSD
jgi:hypothetical protein